MWTARPQVILSMRRSHLASPPSSRKSARSLVATVGSLPRSMAANLTGTQEVITVGVTSVLLALGADENDLVTSTASLSSAIAGEQVSKL